MGVGCGIISTACSVAASGNLSCTAEFCVQGQAQAQDKKTHCSEFQRIKEDRQMDVRKSKGTLKQVAVSALFAVGYTEKENSGLAVQRIIRCSFVKICCSQRKHIWKRNYCHCFCFIQCLSGQNSLMGNSSAICQP